MFTKNSNYAKLDFHKALFSKYYFSTFVGRYIRFFFYIRRDSNKKMDCCIRESIKTTLIRSKFVVPKKTIAIGGDGGQLNAERPWIIERERGRASETTWLLLTNAIWPASGASRAGRSRSVICSPRACVEKRRKERETIRRPNRTDVRRQKVMRHQFLPDQYLFHDQIICEQIGAESTLPLSFFFCPFYPFFAVFFF